MAKLGFLIVLYTGSVLAYTSTEVPSRPKKMSEEDLEALFGNAKAVRSQPSHKDHVVQLLSRFLNPKSDDVSTVARNIKKDLEIELAGISNQVLDAEDPVEWVYWEQAKRELPGHVNDVLVQALVPSFKREDKKELATNKKREGSDSSNLDWYWSLQRDFNDVMEPQEKRTAGELMSSDSPSQRLADKFDTIAMFLPAKALMESKRSWGNPPNTLQANLENQNFKSSNVKSQRSTDQLDTIAMFWPGQTLKGNKRSRGNPPDALQAKSQRESNLKSSNTKSLRSDDQFDTIAMFWPSEVVMENKRSWPIMPQGRQAEPDIENNLNSFYLKGQRSADQLDNIAMFWPAETETLEQNKRSWGNDPQERQAKQEGESSLDVLKRWSGWSLKRSAKPDAKELRASTLRSEPMVASLRDWFDKDASLLTRESGESAVDLPLKSRSSRLKDAVSGPAQGDVWSPNFKRASKQALYDVLDQLAKITKQTGDKRDNTIVSQAMATDKVMFDPSSSLVQSSLLSKRGDIDHIIAMLHPSFAKA